MKNFQALLLAAALILNTACKKEEIDSGEKFLPTQEGYLSVNMQLPNEANTRNVGITPNSDGEIYRYVWKKGNTQRMHVFFKTKDGKTGQSQLDFEVPQDYNGANGKSLQLQIPLPKDWKTAEMIGGEISGAIGVESMDKTGKCTVLPPATISGKNDDYKIPLVFSRTVVNNKGRVKLHLKSYGILLRVVFHPKPGASTATTWNRLKVQTSVFAIQGDFNVDVEAGTLPKFNNFVQGTGDTNAAIGNNFKFTTDKEFTLTDVTAAPDGVAVAYVWGVPDATIKDKTGDQGFRYSEVWLDTNYEAHLIYHRQTKEPWVSGNAYTMNVEHKEGSLIFSEFASESATVGYLELYNPSDAPVFLENYWLFDSWMNSWVDLSNPAILNSYSGETQAWINPNPGIQTIPAYGTLVIGNSGADITYTSKKYWQSGVPGDFKDLPVTTGLTQSLFMQNPDYGRYHIIYRSDAGTAIILDTAEPRGEMSWGIGMIRKPGHDTPKAVFDYTDWYIVTYATTPGFISPWDDNLYHANFGMRFYPNYPPNPADIPWLREKKW